MAGNTGKGHRKGAVKDRSQFYNEKTGKYYKRDAATGRIMAVKTEAFKGVTEESKKKATKAAKAAKNIKNTKPKATKKVDTKTKAKPKPKKKTTK